MNSFMITNSKNFSETGDKYKVIIRCTVTNLNIAVNIRTGVIKRHIILVVVVVAIVVVAVDVVVAAATSEIRNA